MSVNVALLEEILTFGTIITDKDSQVATRPYLVTSLCCFFVSAGK